MADVDVLHQVEVHLLLPVCRIVLDERSHFHQAHNIGKTCQAIQFFVSLIDNAACLVGIGHVADHGMAVDLISDVGGAFRIDIGHCDLGAGIAKEQRRQAAMPVAAADDERLFPFQAENVFHVLSERLTMPMLAGNSSLCTVHCASTVELKTVRSGMMKAKRIGMAIAAMALAAAVTGCWGEEAVDIGPVEPDEVICGVENVEDLVSLPDSPWIIGSGMGGHFFQSGGLHLINEDDRSAKKLALDLAPGLAPRAPFDQCPGPAAAELFSAHGLGIAASDDGGYTLYVVNHGGRESIEVFDVRPTDGEPQVKWVGCVLTPDSAASNSVAARPDGSLVMSASGASDEPMPSFAEIAELTKAGGEMPPMSPDGAVFTWSRADGWNRVPGSELVGNNGIELSRDGKWAWNNSWPGASVTYLPLDPALGKKREVKLPFKPDNIRWSHDGKLVATGHLASEEEVAQCVLGGSAASCAIDYMAAEIDPRYLRGHGTLQWQGHRGIRDCHDHAQDGEEPVDRFRGEPVHRPGIAEAGKLRQPASRGDRHAAIRP